MKQLLTSMARWSWSMSMLGVEQTGSALAALGRGQQPWRAAAAWSAMTHVAQQQLRSSAPANGLAPGSMALADLPRGLLRSALLAGRGSVAVSRPLTSGRAAAGLRELGNKLAAFEDFRYAERAVSPAEGLAARVASSRGLPPFRALWVLEGLGYRHGMAGGGLSSVELPAGELLPLHTGMGLALARRHLDALVATPSGEVLEDWVEACRLSSRPGYGQAVLEALGLIVVGLAPTALLQIDAALADRLPTLRGAYWHGVGRGLYFSPRKLVPGSAKWTLEEALDLAQRARDPVAREAVVRDPVAREAVVRDPVAREAVVRDNVLAGLFWAVTLVNLPAPEVLASWLAQVGDPIEQVGTEASEAVSDGIRGALSLWALFAGRGHLLQSFLEHRSEDRRVNHLWRHWVREPVGSRMAQMSDLADAPETLFAVASAEGDLGAST